MPSSTEKLDHVGRAVAQVRDNYRNMWKRGDITDLQFNAAKLALDEVKIRVRRFEEEEHAYWVSLFASEPESDVA